MNRPGLYALGCALLAIGLVTAPIATTAQSAPMAAPTPVPISHPDFTSMKFLLGTWMCTQPLRGGTRPETDVYSMTMDGMWMLEQSTAPPFDQYRTVAQNGMNYTGYDPSSKQWVSLGVDSLGGFGTSTSPGFQGNVITWTTKNLDGSSGTDITTKVSDNMTTDQSTSTDPQGHASTVTITCKKSAM